MTHSESSFSPLFARHVLLYAEDDAGFVELFRCRLQQLGASYTVVHVTDGEQAIAYLKGEGKYADRAVYPLPAVALLDLKMPRVNGFEVLTWIRQQSTLRLLPVVVLTVSEELRDVQKAYQLGANSFLVKPTSAIDLQEMLHMLDAYWFRHNLSANDAQQRRLEL